MQLSRLRSSVASQSSSLIWSKVRETPAPALFTSTSTDPASGAQGLANALLHSAERGEITDPGGHDTVPELLGYLPEPVLVDIDQGQVRAFVGEERSGRAAYPASRTGDQNVSPVKVEAHRSARSGSGPHHREREGAHALAIRWRYQRSSARHSAECG